MDIEEMAWAPRYGMKGVIDASVRSRVESHNGGSYDRIMPLEFKTGKATSGQVSTYSWIPMRMLLVFMSTAGMVFFISSLRKITQPQG
jgi:hypothetical protein